FEPFGIPGMEDPCGAKLCDVVEIDFMQVAVTTPAVVTVVRRPVRARRLCKQILFAHGDHACKRGLALLPRRWLAHRGSRYQQDEDAAASAHSAIVSRGYLHF